MARRLLFTLLVAGLGGAAFLLARRGPPEDEGLVVHVYVVDQSGAPLADAQAERLFDPGWQVVDRNGYRRLVRVRLRANETPTARAIAHAVRVRARFFTLRRGFEPEIRARTDGSWEARYRLHHHGVLRVHIKGTHLGPVKAFLEPDALGRWEAMDLGNVARPGSPAAFRVYPGMARIVIKVIGTPDQHGAVAVATRRYFLEPPAPGHIVERTLVADEVKPIVGTVLAPDGPRPPTLRGVARITELTPAGRRVEHEPVPIDDEGLFVIRAVGAGRYEIQTTLDFCRAPPALTVEGGETIDIDGAGARPWAVLTHEGFDATEWNGRFVLEDDPASACSSLLGRDKSTVSLPGGGTWHLRGLVLGTDEAPPRELSATVEAEATGAHPASVRSAVLPHGTLVVKTTDASWQRARGATVTLGGRKRTLLKGLAQEAVFHNVRAGPGARVALEWNDPDAPLATAEVDVPADGTAEVTLAYTVEEAPSGAEVK